MDFKIDFFGKKLDYSKGSAVAIGFFDGVHRGHKKIFQSAILQKELVSASSSVAITFDVHPLCLISPGRAPKMINTLEQRIENILDMGIDTVAVVKFDEEFAKLEPMDFIKYLLKERLSAKSVTVGSNFRFGRNRTGNTKLLFDSHEEFDFVINEIAPVMIGGGPVSSTRIRAAVAESRMGDARKFLGDYFALRGVVGKGFQIGSQLGYPTANLIVQNNQLIPGNGVYIVASYIGGKLFFGGCNVGVRPTFGIHDVSIETHFVYWNGDLYGRELEYYFIEKIRDEMQFSSPHQLIERMNEDIALVKEYSDNIELFNVESH